MGEGVSGGEPALLGILGGCVLVRHHVIACLDSRILRTRLLTPNWASLVALVG